MTHAWHDVTPGEHLPSEFTSVIEIPMGSSVKYDNLSFGNQHYFRMSSLPTMYEGYPRFAYGGYSFLLVDPFPGTWAANWYDTDNLYITYDNGYYLYDSRYPSIGLAITVVL